VLARRDIGERETLPAAALFVLIWRRAGDGLAGAEIEWDDRGYVLTGHDVGGTCPLEREPLSLETSVPGASIQLCHRYLAAAAAAGVR
jgi:hypothetical protein